MAGSELSVQQWQERDESGRVAGRFDWISEVIPDGGGTNSRHVTLTPDPRRYISAIIQGEPHYLDTFLKVAIPKAEMMRVMMEQLGGQKIYASPTTIANAASYADGRRTALDSELAGGGYTPPVEASKPQAELQSLSSLRSLGFLSVDVCGGTALRRQDPQAFERAYEIMLRELVTSVSQFHGDILKTTGDGFIAYIDFPAFTTLCDSTVDLGLTLLALQHRSINPALSSAGLPQLQIRVGADYGQAALRRVQIPALRYLDIDIASDALNRAVKIEQGAAPGEMRIGRALYELLHVRWLQRCTAVPFDATKLGIEGYPVYRVR